MIDITRIPSAVMRTVLCAASLMCLGVAMFVAGVALWATEGTSAFVGLVVCGALAFVPGFYYSRLAYCAYCQRAGYSWADLPDWEAY